MPRKSPIHEAFDTVKVDGKLVRICKLCPLEDPPRVTELEVNNSGTTNCLRHIKKEHGKTEVGKKILQNSVNLIESHLSYEDRKTQIDEALVYLITQKQLPFSLVDSEEWKNFCFLISGGKYTSPTASYLSETLIPVHCTRVENYLIYKAGTAAFMCLVVDLWTSKNHSFKYLGVAVAFIDEGFNLCFQNLATTELDTDALGRYSSETIVVQIRSILDDFKICEDKIIGISSDTAAEMKRVAFLMEVDWIGCGNHRMALVLKDAFTQSGIDPLVSKFKAGTAFIHRSVKRKTELRKHLSNPKNLQVKAITEIRWNSFYYAATRALEIATSYNSVLHNNKREYELSQEEIANLNMLCSVLQIFEITTRMWSSQTKFWGMCPFFENLKKQIRDSYSKRLSDIDEERMIYVTATFLDSRFKDFAFYESGKAKECIKLATKQLHDLFRMSQFFYPQIDAVPDAPSQFRTEATRVFGVGARDFVEPSTQENLFRRELRNYKNYATESDVLGNPCDFWKNHQEEFPFLSLMAKRFLCLMHTSTRIENSFSSTTDLLSPKRKGMNPNLVKQSCFLKHNMKSFMLDQNKKE